MTVQKDIDLGLDDDEPSTVVPGNKEEVSSNDILAYSGQISGFTSENQEQAEPKKLESRKQEALPQKKAPEVEEKHFGFDDDVSNMFSSVTAQPEIIQEQVGSIDLGDLDQETVQVKK